MDCRRAKSTVQPEGWHPRRRFGQRHVLAEHRDKVRVDIPCPAIVVNTSAVATACRAPALVPVEAPAQSRNRDGRVKDSAAKTAAANATAVTFVLAANAIAHFISSSG